MRTRKQRSVDALEILKTAVGDRPGTADSNVNALTIPVSVPYWVAKYVIELIEGSQKTEWVHTEIKGYGTAPTPDSYLADVVNGFSPKQETKDAN